MIEIFDKVRDQDDQCRGFGDASLVRQVAFPKPLTASFDRIYIFTAAKICLL